MKRSERFYKQADQGALCAVLGVMVWVAAAVWGDRLVLEDVPFLVLLVLGVLLVNRDS